MRDLFFCLLFIVYSACLMARHESKGFSSLRRNLPNGVYAAALTPMRSDLSCDREQLASHCFDLVERGCAGVALFGTTGEGPSFSVAERISVLDGLIEAGFDARKVILANGSSNLFDTVELARAALKQGCAGVLIAPPSFYKKISDEGVLAFYRGIIERVADPKLRVILYHIPQFSGVPISLSVIEELRKEFPGIVVGIKESEGNLPLTKAILEKFPGFKVFVGNESQIIEAVSLRGAGAICGIANLYPELMCSLYEQGKRGLVPNPPSVEAIFKALNGIPFIPAAKAVMKARQGEIWHAVRPPLVPLDQMRSESFLFNLREYGLEK